MSPRRESRSSYLLRLTRETLGRAFRRRSRQRGSSSPVVSTGPDATGEVSSDETAADAAEAPVSPAVTQTSVAPVSPVEPHPLPAPVDPETLIEETPQRNILPSDLIPAHRMVASDRLNWKAYAVHCAARATRGDVGSDRLGPDQVEALARAAYQDGQAGAATNDRRSAEPASNDALLARLRAEHPMVPEAAVAGWCAGVRPSTLSSYVGHIPIVPPIRSFHRWSAPRRVSAPRWMTCSNWTVSN